MELSEFEVCRHLVGLEVLAFILRFGDLSSNEAFFVGLCVLSDFFVDICHEVEEALRF